MSSHWFVSKAIPSVLIALVVFFGAAALPAFSEEPFLLKDVNTRTNSAAPTSMFAGTNLIFFDGFDTEHGSELWISDGTNAGTRFLKDLNPGPESSFPSQFAAATIGGTQVVFFVARTATSGFELWRSDGTVNGTFEIELNPGIENSTPRSIVPFGDSVLFHATSANGRELWRSSGTALTTQEVINIAPGATDGISFSAEITLVPGGTTAVFPANDPINGVELFRTQGTLLTTALVANLAPASQSSSPQSLLPVPALGRVAFGAFGPGAGLFTTDGVTISPLPISSGGDPSFFEPPSDLALIEPSTVLFVGNRTAEGRELWRTNAALTQVFRVADLVPGSESFFSNITNARRIKSVNGRGVFQGEVPFVNPEPGVFSTDGVSIFTISDALPFFRGGLTSLNFAARLFFKAQTDAVGAELFSSDGTPQGTRLEADILPGILSSSPGQFVIFKGDMYYSVSTTSGDSLFKTTAAGSTVEVANLAVAGTKDSGASFGMPQSAGFASNKILFIAIDNDRGIELFGTDGTAAGTGLVSDINPGSDSSFPDAFAQFGNGSFFSARTNAEGEEPWFSDGTAAGTRPLGDIKPGRESGLNGQRERGVVGGKLLFAANDGTHGQELWATDGTAAGTQLLKDVNLGAGNGVRDENNPDEFGVANGIFYFAGNDTGSTTLFNFELWRSDGTAAGTFQVKDIRPELNQSSSPKNFAALQSTGEIIFSASTALHGQELWKSDGTEAGTVLVKDIRVGTGSSSLENPRALDTLVLFSASNGTQGEELWRTDGTEAGTQIVLDINPGASGSRLFPLAVLSNRLFFAADDGTHGRELWITDGTSAGTILFDLNPGAGESFVQSVVQIEDSFYIGVTTFDTNGASQEKLFKSNGTAAGTVEVPLTGSATFSTFGMTFFRGLLLFNGKDPVVGSEPFALLFDACPDDQAKKSLGTCGCGIADVDANANGITDCLSNAELKARLQALKELLRQLKLPKNSRQVNKTKKKITAIKAQRKDISSFANASAGTLTIKSGVNLSSLLKKINKTAKQAFKLSSRTFKNDRKLAIKAVDAAITAID